MDRHYPCPNCGKLWERPNYGGICNECAAAFAGPAGLFPKPLTARNGFEPAECSNCRHLDGKLLDSGVGYCNNGCSWKWPNEAGCVSHDRKGGLADLLEQLRLAVGENIMARAAANGVPLTWDYFKRKIITNFAALRVFEEEVAKRSRRRRKVNDIDDEIIEL